MKEKNILTNPWIVALLAFICCALWGSAFPSIKIGYRLMGIEGTAMNCQLLYAGLRFTLAGILVLLFAMIQRKGKIENVILKIGEGFYKDAFLLSLVQTVLQYLFFYIGLANTEGSKAAIITGSGSFMAIITAAFLFRSEKMTVKKAVGCVLGFLGVICVNFSAAGLATGFKLLGEGAIICSASAYGISGPMIKELSKKRDTVLLSGYQFTIGGIILSVVGYAMGGRLKFTALSQGLLLLYLGFISAGAYTLWGILMKHNPVSRVSIYGFMNPVVGVILSFLLLKEATEGMGLRSVIALLLVTGGILVVNLVPKNSKQNAESSIVNK